MRRFAAAPFPRVSLALVAAVVLLLTAACSQGDTGDESGDPLQVVENPEAATVAKSPAVEEEPAGKTLPVDGDVSAMLTDADSGTLVVARAHSPAVLLYDLQSLGGEPRSATPMPGKVTDLTVSKGHVLASVPSAGAIMRLPLSQEAREAQEAERIGVQGKPSATARQGSHTLIALRDRHTVLVRDGGKITKSMTGNLYSINDVVVAASGEAFVLDRVRTALFHVQVGKSDLAEGLRAGAGATNATVDPHGRVLVTDTRGGALLTFSTDPFLMRQRYPVPGGIYAVAYDGERDLAWVTLTKRNEVVGYDMHGGEPQEEYRFPTVRQPNSVTVDERTGRVIVASAVGKGMQVIEP